MEVSRSDIVDYHEFLVVSVVVSWFGGGRRKESGLTPVCHTSQ